MLDFDKIFEWEKVKTSAVGVILWFLYLYKCMWYTAFYLCILTINFWDNANLIVNDGFYVLLSYVFEYLTIFIDMFLWTFSCNCLFEKNFRITICICVFIYSMCVCMDKHVKVHMWWPEQVFSCFSLSSRYGMQAIMMACLASAFTSWTISLLQ